MNDSQKASAITRSGVVIIGLATIAAGIYMLRPLIVSISTFLSPAWMNKGNVIFLIASLLGPIILIPTGIVFLKQADHIAFKYYSASCSTIERTIYRIAFATVGLFLFTSSLTYGLQLVGNLLCKYLEVGYPLDVKSDAIWPYAIRFLTELILGIYLFLGAPSLLGWHLKRCSIIDENN